MCGIAGILASDKSLVNRDRLKKMTDAIRHRGPESEAFWISGNLGFGHRRLCIIDLSAAAAQPMHYLDRYTIVFNGEIYNYIELRETLVKKGYHFRSSSDTEVLLAAWACYKEECLQHLEGMFAFAIWDIQEQLLFAARDRFGEKPFYFYSDDASKEFLFASEIKALWAAGVNSTYDGSMLLNYLALGWTEHPVEKQKTFYKNIHALPPAHYLMIGPGTEPVLSRYWQLDAAESATDIGAAVNGFAEKFHGAVERRLRSDVPVGTSLSGGLDSSSVLASASRSENLLYTHKSFSAVFPGYAKDESYYIKLISDRHRTQNYFTSPGAADLGEEFGTFMHYHEQPVATASAFAQYKVYQLARENNVTVMLDGQGADEVLAGYSKYINWYLQELWRTNATAFRKEKNALQKNDVPFSWSIRNILAASMPLVAADQLHMKALKLLQSQPDISAAFKEAYLDKQSLYKPAVRTLNDILHFNCTQFGLGELLRYADSNSMAHSREVRLPFLSHELVSFVFSLPATMKIHEGWSKWILRKTMAPALPPEIAWRKDKIGFEPPQSSWMHDPQLAPLILESRKKLVDLQILKPSAAVNETSPSVELAWRYMVAARLLE